MIFQVGGLSEGGLIRRGGAYSRIYGRSFFDFQKAGAKEFHGQMRTDGKSEFAILKAQWVKINRKGKT